MKDEVARLLHHPSRRALLLLAATLLLAACTGDEMKNAASASMKSWCRNASNCNVHEQQ